MSFAADQQSKMTIGSILGVVLTQKKTSDA